jgi:hypothetical protein
MASESEQSISVALEQLALALGNAGAVPRGELVRALERAAERLRARPLDMVIPTDVVSQAEAARLVGVSRQAVNQWVRKGILRTYDTAEGKGRALVSLAEITIAANRWRAEPFPAALRRQLKQFLEALSEHHALAYAAGMIGESLEEGLPESSVDDVARVLREFLVAAMGTAGRQQEFTSAGVQMLADLRPALVVDAASPFGQLLDELGLLLHTSDGSAGFDSPSAAILGILGAATVGTGLSRPKADLAEYIATTAHRVWGEDWVRRIFDAAYHTDELNAPPMTRYTAPLVYLGTNRFMRQAQSDGVSITYAATPGALLPQSYYGGPVMTEILSGHRRSSYPWQFKKGTRAVHSALHASAKTPFRIFNFEYGLFDSSIHGIRRYCFSTERAREALRAFADQLPPGDRGSYYELAVETLAHALQKPFVEMSAVEPPAAFDWWKDHIIRSSPRETLIGLRGEKARNIAHGLLVRATTLPQILESRVENPEMRERLRIYVKNLSYEITDERYRDDLKRGITRAIKTGAEELSQQQAFERAEAEVRSIIG